MSTPTQSKLAATARKLAALTFDANGDASLERTRDIVAVLSAKFPSAQLRPLLTAYHAELRREFANREARVEHAGPLPPDALERLAAHFSRLRKHRVNARAHENPALLAGLRVRIGDDVFDASVRSALEHLR
jgi:F-type H+-transporting ATPase subunit delta